VQRSHKALEPPHAARDDIAILTQLARRLGREWDYRSSEEVWDEVRALSPMHAGMTYARLEALGGIQWPCPTEDHPGTPILHTRLWVWPLEGPPAPLSVVEHDPPVDELSPEFPIRLTTGRRLDSFNTGVQSGRFPSPLRGGETIDLHPTDAAGLQVREGDLVRVVSRRGSVEAPVRLDSGLRPGLAFMTLHFPDEVPTNRLTIDAYDPKSGTAEFKATAIRVERIGAGAPA
jgi:formate dehydrogenase major subunit